MVESRISSLTRNGPLRGELQEEEAEDDFSFWFCWDHPSSQTGNTSPGPGLWENRIKYWNFLWISCEWNFSITDYWISRFGVQQESVILRSTLGSQQHIRSCELLETSGNRAAWERVNTEVVRHRFLLDTHMKNIKFLSIGRKYIFNNFSSLSQWRHWEGT